MQYKVTKYEMANLDGSKFLLPTDEWTTDESIEAEKLILEQAHYYYDEYNGNWLDVLDTWESQYRIDDANGQLKVLYVITTIHKADNIQLL